MDDPIARDEVLGILEEVEVGHIEKVVRFPPINPKLLAWLRKDWQEWQRLCREMSGVTAISREYPCKK